MITLRDAELYRLDLRLRMPFRYGIATLTELPHAIVRLTFEFSGRRAAGFAADNLPPKWFTKDPAADPADELAVLWQVIQAAIRHARAIRAATPFAFWRELYAAQAAWAESRQLPPLLAHFGTSFVERALIDAYCRHHGLTFSAALRANALGIEFGSVRPTLGGSSPADWLPAQPVTTVHARHTIGLADPLGSDEIAPGDRLSDGLPQTLAECIRAYGLTHFKIKINGEPERDRQRLGRMAVVFDSECRGDFAFSLDGNESFHDVAAFTEYFQRLSASPELTGLWSRLLFVEQPWHRAVALSPAMAELERHWPKRPAIIIDESDGDLGSLPAALALGYAGTSHKNCKGIFKSVVNACLLEQRRRAGQPAVLSGEDLTNLGPIALTQDLAAAAALGINSIERNGHHYFAGLSQFPPSLQEHSLKHYPDLFVRGPTGWPQLRIERGKLALGSVNAAPFGVAGEPDLSGLAVVPTT